MENFPTTLKLWRNTRRYSQLELAIEAEISARHLSFLETGRAKPSREMVCRLGKALRLPLEARNQMLNRAGFAAQYKKRDWTEAEMTPIRKAVDTMLAHHMPFPGIAVDRLWSIKAANEAALALFGQFGIGIGGSMLDLVQSEVLPEVVENWPEVAQHAALRLRTESISQGGVAVLDKTAKYLSTFQRKTPYNPGPVIPTIIKQGDQRLSLFATISQFGTPEDVALDELKVELYFPMDSETEDYFRSPLAR